MRRLWRVVRKSWSVVLGAAVVVLASGAFPSWTDTNPTLIVVGALAVVFGVYEMAGGRKKPSVPTQVKQIAGGVSAYALPAIATFTRLPKASLPALERALAYEQELEGDPQDSLSSYLQKHGRPAAEYKWSGYTMATVLVYLEEQGIDLMTGEYDELSNELTETLDSTHFVFTPAHRDAYLSSLDSGEFFEGPLREYYREFNHDDDPNSGKAMLAGIKAIAQSLRMLDDDSVILLAVE